jgi:hypothetical protein
MSWDKPKSVNQNAIETENQLLAVCMCVPSAPFNTFIRADKFNLSAPASRSEIKYFSWQVAMLCDHCCVPEAIFHERFSARNRIPSD